MKLLEEQVQAEESGSFVHTVDDEDRSEEDFLSRRNSLVGKEIVSSGYREDSSPVSIASGLFDVAVASKQAYNHRDVKVDSSMSKEGETASISNTKVANVQQQIAIRSTPIVRRHFGDVTNSSRVDESKVMSSLRISSKIKLFQGETSQRQKKDTSWINANPDCKMTPLTDKKDRYMELSTPAKAAMKKYLTPSPPTAVARTKLCTSSRLDKVGPNPEDHNRFCWAYNIWFQAGLMEENPRYNTTNPSFWQKGNSNLIRKSLAHLSPEFSIDKKRIAPELSSPESSTSPSICTPEGIIPSANEVLVKLSEDGNMGRGMESVDSTDKGRFKNILDMWRDHSKEKKGSKKVLSHSRPKTPQNEAKSTIDYVAPTRSKSFPPKQPEEKKSPSRQPSPKRFGELSAISVASSELVPYNFEASGNLSSQIVPSERSFVDSDLCDYNHYYGGASSKALVILQNSDKTYDVVVGESCKGAGEQLVIRNLENFAASTNGGGIEDEQKCECLVSVFSGNNDLISFFLPQMGMACTCGQQRRSLVNPNDPTGIENILRQWQCEFLRSFGIYRGEQLVHARHRSADILAKALRQWRKKHNMTPFKTSACLMALNIWSKTCKTYVRSIRKQILDGNQLLERQSGTLMNELSLFLNSLPEAPTKQDMEALCIIEPESQVEV
jgi:hypothetical protein